MQIPVEVTIARDPELEEKLRIERLVAESVLLKVCIDRDSARLDDLKAELGELPPGKYVSDAGARATVVAAGTAIKPDQAQVAAARQLAGIHARLLFEREVVYKPKPSFRDIVRALLTPAKADKIIALCEKPTAAQVRL